MKRKRVFSHTGAHTSSGKSGPKGKICAATLFMSILWMDTLKPCKEQLFENNLKGIRLDSWQNGRAPNDGEKLCCVIPRQACHLVKLAVRQSARDKLLSLHLTHCLSLETLPCSRSWKWYLSTDRGDESWKVFRNNTCPRYSFERILVPGILCLWLT